MKRESVTIFTPAFPMQSLFLLRGVLVIPSQILCHNITQPEGPLPPHESQGCRMPTRFTALALSRMPPEATVHLNHIKLSRCKESYSVVKTFRDLFWRISNEKGNNYWTYCKGSSVPKYQEPVAKLQWYGRMVLYHSDNITFKYMSVYWCSRLLSWNSTKVPALDR